MTDEELILLHTAFKKGGQGFTFTEWMALSAEEQAAAIAAGTRLQDELAAKIALYIQNPVEAIMVLSGEDAGVRSALTK